MEKILEDNLEQLAIELGELADVAEVIWAGLQTDGMDMQKALSCISYTKDALKLLEERIQVILEEENI